LRLPPLLRVSSPLAISTSYSTDSGAVAAAADSSSILGLTIPVAFSAFRDPTAQADLSRLTNTLKMLVEMNGQCWKGQDCDLSDGVRQGINVVSAHTQRHADLLELRVRLSPPSSALVVTFSFVAVLTGCRGGVFFYFD
jgi:sorting nexin-8